MQEDLEQRQSPPVSHSQTPLVTSVYLSNRLPKSSICRSVVLKFEDRLELFILSDEFVSVFRLAATGKDFLNEFAYEFVTGRWPDPAIDRLAVVLGSDDTFELTDERLVGLSNTGEALATGDMLLRDRLVCNRFSTSESTDSFALSGLATLLFWDLWGSVADGDGSEYFFWKTALAGLGIDVAGVLLWPWPLVLLASRLGVGGWLSALLGRWLLLLGMLVGVGMFVENCGCGICNATFFRRLPRLIFKLAALLIDRVNLPWHIMSCHITDRSVPAHRILAMTAIATAFNLNRKKFF